MKCPKCNAKVEGVDNYCPSCGGLVKDDKKTCGLAKASFVLGILGIILFFVPLFSFLAIIFGIIGLVRIGSSKEYSGAGYAIAGIVLGILQFVFWIVILFNFQLIAEFVGPWLKKVLSTKF